MNAEQIANWQKLLRSQGMCAHVTDAEGATAVICILPDGHDDGQHARPSALRTMLHVSLSEIPGSVRESARIALSSQGYYVVDRKGNELSPDDFERLLRTIGNNSAQAMTSADENPANER